MVDLPLPLGAENIINLPLFISSSFWGKKLAEIIPKFLF
jgi:hypothetical protein